MPMAGLGSRFKNSDYSLPKPLIMVEDKPMFLKSLESIDGINYSDIYFIVKREHDLKHAISDIIKKNVPNSHVFLVDDTPNGQLMSILSIEEKINKDEDLLIISSDTLVVSNLKKKVLSLPESYKGLISLINKKGDQWSFAKINSSGDVTEVAEKKRISSLASTGIYYFKNGKEFVKLSKKIIKKKIKVNDEYYVMPVYQEYINAKFKISSSIAKEMWDMGTPKSLKEFLNKKQ